MILLDSNVLIYHAEGKLRDKLPTDVYGASVISEIEVLGHAGLSKESEANLLAMLTDIVIIPIDTTVKREAIRLRRTTSLRLPGAIIAATAIAKKATLLTHDANLLELTGVKASAPPFK